MSNTGLRSTRCANTTTRTLMPSQLRARMQGPRVVGTAPQRDYLVNAVGGVPRIRYMQDKPCGKCRYLVCCCALNATAPIEPVKRDYGTCACGSSAVHQRTDACWPAPSERTIAAALKAVARISDPPSAEPAAHEPRVAVQVGDTWVGAAHHVRGIQLQIERSADSYEGHQAWRASPSGSSCTMWTTDYLQEHFRLVSRAPEPELRAGWRDDGAGNQGRFRRGSYAVWKYDTFWQAGKDENRLNMPGVQLSSWPSPGAPWCFPTALAAMTAVDALIAQQAAEAGADDAESGLRAMGFERTDDSSEGAMYQHPKGAWVALWKGGGLWAGGRVGQGAAEHEHPDWRAAAAHALGRDGA